MTIEPDAARCTLTHYFLPTDCALPAGHGDDWHQTVHPETGQLLRFRSTAGIHHTQEWEPYDDDPGMPNAGKWVTWHYLSGKSGPTSNVPKDLDQRVAAFVSNHFETGLVRSSENGQEDCCSCGTWYPSGRSNAHLGRELSLLVRSYFDDGLRCGRLAQLAN